MNRAKLGNLTANQKQHEIWEAEHKKPFMFPFVDSRLPNPGVVEFWNWIESRQRCEMLRGLEVCCGKGRNAIWIAEKGVEMFGFDFSTIAIAEARLRQEQLLLAQPVDFQVQDATDCWVYADRSFDFVLDCFGSSDIESEVGRENILNEALRVLKPGGYYFLQIDSPEMGFFSERFKEAPGLERNTLIFPNGKVEAVLTEHDLKVWSHPLKLIEVQRKIETTLEIFGQMAPFKYYWIVAQAPWE